MLLITRDVALAGFGVAVIHRVFVSAVLVEELAGSFEQASVAFAFGSHNVYVIGKRR